MNCEHLSSPFWGWGAVAVSAYCRISSHGAEEVMLLKQWKKAGKEHL